MPKIRSTIYDDLSTLTPIRVLRDSDWTPCKSDPFFFDCSDCEISWTECRYRSDPDLRMYRAFSRARDRTKVARSAAVGEGGKPVSLLVKEILRKQGGPVPVQILLSWLENSANINIGFEELKVRLLRDRELAINASNTVWFSSENEVSRADVFPWWYQHYGESGEEISLMAEQSAKTDRTFQLVGFKRLAALRMLRGYGTESVARKRLSTLAQIRIPEFSQITGLGLPDILRIVSSIDPLPSKAVEQLKGDKSGWVSELLTGLFAERLLAELPFESVEHELQMEKERAVVSNLALVANTARRYSFNRQPSFADLFQEGVTGLLAAIEKFDPYFGTRFSTYATWWIRQAITRASADQGNTIRMPVHVVEQVRKVQASIRDLDNSTTDLPAISDLSEQTEIKVEKISELVKWGTSTVRHDKSIHDVVYDHQFDEKSFLGTTDPFDAVSDSLDRILIRNLLGLLPDRERKVIEQRFGVIDGDTHTLEEIGRHFGLTRERIRQIERKALTRCRYLLGVLTGKRLVSQPEASIRHWGDSILRSKSSAQTRMPKARRRRTKTNDHSGYAAKGLLLAVRRGLRTVESSPDIAKPLIVDPLWRLHGKLPPGWTPKPEGYELSGWEPVWEFDSNGTTDGLNESEHLKNGTSAEYPSTEQGTQIELDIEDSEFSPGIDASTSAIQFFSQIGIQVVDNRRIGGALWVVVGKDNPEYSQRLRDWKFTYKRKGGKATSKQSAWFRK
jgi:RNA polymerase primary sigma factor